MSDLYYRKILKIGHSYALTLPQNVVSYLQLVRGDVVYLQVTGRSVVVTKADKPRGAR